MSQSANGPVHVTDLVLADTDAHLRRRLILTVIAEEAEPIALETLAKKIAMLERHNTDDPQYERIAIALHHVYLPQLAEAGIVEYDPATHELSRRAPT